MLDDIALFIKIVESGSFNEAARILDMPPSTLTRRVQNLERQLGCKLLLRSAHRTVPTQEGWQYFEQCRPLLYALAQTTQKLDETFNQVSGTLQVLAPTNLANGLLAPAWVEFMQENPLINLSLILANHTEDLIGKGADLAIRIGKQPDSSLNMRKLGSVTNLLVASPNYLRHAPHLTMEKLDKHKLIVANPLSIWTFKHKQSNETFRITPKAYFEVNDLYLAIKTTLAGLGILFCPLSLCYKYIEQGDLVPVLPEWQNEPREIFAVWSQQQFLPARVRAMVDFLVSYVKTQPLLND
ncbi:LysR family transcriptional regulator [Neisseria sp. Ec49-e6-T10]|uniref:LysR family transcriptional regulator n=1 Tax=Neisseria sp. Ec49-e6-T10 TaxID=3140744 RepID=UPI003EB77D14